MAKSQERFSINIETDTTVGQVSEGIHNFRCTKAEVASNKAGDGQNLVLSLACQTPGETGRTLRTWISLKEPARWKLTEVLLAFGAEPKTVKGKPVVKMTQDLFIGKTVRAQVVHEDWNGEERASIDRILPPEAAQPSKAVAEAAELDDWDDEDEDDGEIGADEVEDDDDDEWEDEDEEDEEDEEEAPPPPPAKSVKAAGKGSKSKPKPAPADDDDDFDPEEDLPF